MQSILTSASKVFLEQSISIDRLKFCFFADPDPSKPTLVDKFSTTSTSPSTVSATPHHSQRGTSEQSSKLRVRVTEPPAQHLPNLKSFFHTSLLGFGWKRVTINSGPKEPKGHVKEKTREPVTTRSGRAVHPSKRFLEIGSRVGRNQTTVMRICDLWMQEGSTDRHGRSHQPQCTTSREDRQIVHMAVTDRSVTSRTISQHIESVTHHSVSGHTIRRRLQHSGLSPRRPFLDLPLTQNHRRLRRQWCDERRMCVAE
ncbi:transposable element Tcb1 transposase [Trichonephila clavipes]|nr:transposable element Tcb1 transposase [Trichonephila clavipes]